MTQQHASRSGLLRRVAYFPPTAKLTRFAPDGAIVPVWEIDALRLPRDIDAACTFLYRDLAAAQAGDGERGATAFWVSAEVAGGRVVFLVTNRHVVEDGATTLRFNTTRGIPDFWETTEPDWRYPSDPNLDLALLPVPPKMWGHPGIIASHFDTTSLISAAMMDSQDVRLGDDVTMIGRHVGYDGKTINQPTARFGHIAQFPGDPIPDDRRRSSKCFLIQIPSMPGYSGSPVLLVQDIAEKNMELGSLMLGSNMARTLILLGVNKGHLPYYAPTYMGGSTQRNEAVNAEINSGISVVVPAWDLNSFVSDCIAQMHAQGLLN